MATRKLPDFTKTAARGLRRDMTEAEGRLWYNLRRQDLGGYKFRRQHPFGSYILDFYCPRANLVAEVDGGQHFDTETVIRDAARTHYLEEHGMTVLRFSNLDVLQETDSVLSSILHALEDPSP